MVEIDYAIGTDEAELRRLFAAEVVVEELVDAHDAPWLSRGLEPPRRTAKGLRAKALASLLEHAKQPAVERVLTLKEAAPVLGLSERSLRHAVDQGDYHEGLTETSGGLRALRFRETARIWALPRFRGPDPRVLAAMIEKGVGPGERHEWKLLGSNESQTYVRRRDCAKWRATW
jgi:hypothetical protein